MGLINEDQIQLMVKLGILASFSIAKQEDSNSEFNLDLTTQVIEINL